MGKRTPFVRRHSTRDQGETPIAPDGNRVVVVSGNGAELWAVDPPRPLISPPRERIPVARSADGAFTAAQTDHGGLYERGDLVLESSGRCVALGVRLGGHWHHDIPALFSPDGHFLYVNAEQVTSRSMSSFHLFATRSASLVNTITVADAVDVYLLPGAGRVGFAVPGGVQLFDAHSGEPVAVASAPRTEYSRPNAAGVSSLVRSGCGDMADAFTGPVSATADGRYLIGQGMVREHPVSVWDLADRHHPLDLPSAAPREGVAPVVLSPNEKWIAAGMENGVVLLWTRDGTPAPVAARHVGEVSVLAFSADGQRLASASRDGVVSVTDTRTGAMVGEVTLVADDATFLYFSPDSTTLAIDTERRFEITVTMSGP